MKIVCRDEGVGGSEGEEELFCLGRVFPGFCEGEDRREARAEVKKGVSFGYGLGKGLEVGWEVP